MPRGATLSLLILLVLAFAASAEESRLQRVRDDVNAPSSAANNSTSSDNNDDNFLGSFLSGLFSSSCDGSTNFGGMALGMTLLAPFYLPAALLDDRYEQRMYFSAHPYAGNYRGYQLVAAEVAPAIYDVDTAEIPRRHWAVRLAVENGNDFDGLNRVGGQLRIEHACRFGVITNWNYFHENLSSGRTDETVIGDTNLIFRFAQNEMASMYTGLGFRMLSDRHDTNFGFNFTYGGDWYPVRPLVVSGVLDLGTLGNAGIVHARGSVGVISHGIEFYLGYDFLQIGGTQLQGPMAGMRFWF